METVTKWLKTKWGRIGVTRFDRKSLRKRPDHVAVAMMTVPSESRKGKSYSVMKYRNAALNYSCECDDFRYRLRRCKHIKRAAATYRRYRRDRTK